jgi:hypothetical protein
MSIPYFLAFFLTELSETPSSLLILNIDLTTNFMTLSIRNQPVFIPKTNKEVCMEDVRAMKLALMDAMEARGVSMGIDDENKFYDSLSLFLEESFNWPDYRNLN